MAVFYRLFAKGDQWLENDVTEASGGTVEFFDAGTSSPQTVHSDSARTVSLGTSVTLDSNGRFQTDVYLGTAAVKYELKDSDSNVIFPAVDNVPGGEEENAAGFTKPEILANVKNATGSIDSGDASESFLLDSSSADITLTLDNSSDYGNGHPLVWLKKDSGNNVANVESTSSEGLDAFGATRLKFRRPNEGALTLPDGSRFWSIMFNHTYREYGCQTSNGTDADHDIDITAGSYWSSDNHYFMVGDAMTKQLDASWVAGTNQGGLFTGAIAASTTYHLFQIANPATQDVDYGFHTSTDPSADLPSGYTKYRRIKSLSTDSSENIIPYIQHANITYFSSPQFNEYGTTGSNTTRTHALLVPTGVRLYCSANVFMNAAGQSYIFPTDATELSTNNTASPLMTTESGSGAHGRQIQIMTDTSAQIKFRTTVDTTLRFAVLSYIDNI